MAKTNTKSLSAETARAYRKKHGKKMPNLKLARIMYKENPLLFKNLDAARSRLRYIEGQSGNANRKCLGTSAGEFLRTEPRPKNPYNLPESDETVYEPYHIKGFKKVGILSDIHLPYHSLDAITLAIQHLRKSKIDALLLNGDVLDFYQLSRFVKDPSKRSFAHELNTFKKFFEVLQKQLKCKIFYKIGNHDLRYEKYLLEKAHELIGVKEFSFDSLIKARANGIEIIGDKTVMKLNSLNGIHGHEYIGGISAPVNVARGLYLRGKVSAFQGHNHSSSSHTESDMNGKVTTTYSIGCLAELHPSYMPLNKWNWGFAEVFLDDNGADFEFYNHTIYKGKVY